MVFVCAPFGSVKVRSKGPNRSFAINEIESPLIVYPLITFGFEKDHDPVVPVCSPLIIAFDS